jgi:hypothetical protein
MAQKIQIRRGVEAQRSLVTPDVGELIFTTDAKQVYVGDGATAGGLPVTASSAAFVAKLRGTRAIAAGADSVAVTGAGFASVPAQVLVTVRKVTGGMNLFASVRGDSITTDGFTVDLSAATDTANYSLDYLVVL